LIAVLPRRTSIRISPNAGIAGAIGNCTKAGAIAGAVSSTTGIGWRRVGGSIPRSRIHRRTWFALTPLAIAMPATEAPGSQHASITASLNSSG